MHEWPPFAAIENAEAESWFEIQQHAAPWFRDRVGLSVQRIAGAVSCFATKEDMASLNRVWLPGSAGTVTPETLQEILDVARRLGKTRFVAHCPTWAARPSLMAEHGFRERPPLMQLARRTTTEIPKAPLHIEDIGPDDAELFGRVAAAANELDPWMSGGLNSTVGLPGWMHYLVFDGHTPIAAAGLRLRNGFAWCCFAGTLPAYRGRGAQSALLQRRIRDAARGGCEWIVAEAMPESTSLRNQQRAGFEVVYARPNYVADLTP